MPYFEWEPETAIGHDLIDDDHRTFIAFLNELYERGDDPSVVERIFGLLETYTTEHFGREEELMRKIGYPALAPHRREHALLAKLFDEQKALLHGGDQSPDGLLRLLRMWLSEHLKKSDAKLGMFLRKTGMPSSTPSSVGKVDWSRLTVAIIDDTVEMRTIIKAMLRAFGAVNLIGAFSGESFLGMMADGRRQVDLLLIDDMMEPMRGLDLIATIRRNTSLGCHRAVAILMTGTSNLGAVREALDTGFHSVVVRPFSANGLRLQAERFLGQPLAWETVNGLLRPVPPRSGNGNGDGRSAGVNA